MRILLLTLFAGMCGAGCMAALAADPLHSNPVLTELAWISPDGDTARALTSAPSECLRAPEEDETVYRVEIGRAAFRSPLLFGGQAARQGLSCQSCHVNGHGNPVFFITGLSGESGTADVTSSVFSNTREDGEFNPVAIPSLVGIAEKTNFGTQAPAPSLHAFISGAVEHEFQGAPPPDAVMDGLAAYVAHLDPSVCADVSMMRTVREDMTDVIRTLDAAITALDKGDAATADFLMVSAQAALGRVHERFAGAGLNDQREALRSVSVGLAAARRVAGESAVNGAAPLEQIRSIIPAITEDLHAHRRRSLYDVGVLRAALEAAEQ